MTTYVNYFFFQLYPYIAVTFFLVGSWLRYDYNQYTWQAGSSQFFDKKTQDNVTRWALNLFHIGIIGIFIGHFLGMLTPHWVYESFLPIHIKQLLAILLGGTCGVLMAIGGMMLVYRRLFNPRVRANSSFMDTLILLILVLQCLIGLGTIFISLQQSSGSLMLNLVNWAQSIVIFRPGAADYLMNVSIIFKIHLVLGLTIFLLLPFTRLVHIWSMPIGYLFRRTQIVRLRR